MGHIFAELELSNPRISELGAIKINALADTGALSGSKIKRHSR